MNPSPSLVKKISGLFLWGMDGNRPSSDLKRFLKTYPPAGLILFKRNVESPSQIRALTRSLKACFASNNPPLIGIDEEGGRVSRLPESLLKFPPAVFFGKIYERERDPRLLSQFGRLLARELLSLGINTDFAPVLDVHSNPKNPIIGDRAFSSDPKLAAQAALAFYDGMKKEGLIACGKHFPGHGDTETDSHLTLPYVTKNKKHLERVELLPFRQAISQGIPMLMTAHVVYKALDPKNPATLSPLILQGILRKKMRFKGVIISDDLLMKAVSAKASLLESSLGSLRAGVDILLICQDPCQDTIQGEDLIQKIAREVGKDSDLKKRVEESWKRISFLRK